MYWWIKRKLRELPYQVRRKIKSIKIGFNVEDTYSIDYAFGKWICPRLRYFKSNTHSFPYNMTEKEWDDILTEMLLGFKLVEDEYDYFDCDKEKVKMINRSLDLFKEHFYNLWD